MNSLNIKFSADLNFIFDQVCEVMDFISSQYGTLDDSVDFELKVILNELLVNAIKHGSCGDNLKCIHLNVGMVDDTRLYINVNDEGDGFNHAALTFKASAAGAAGIDPCDSKADDIDIMSECGRGLLIVKKLTDCVKFNSNGNSITVVKRIFSKLPECAN